MKRLNKKSARRLFDDAIVAICDEAAGTIIFE